MSSVEKKRIRLSELHDLKVTLRKSNLNTVCEEARCPNINNCFSKKTATFMILGDTCTRNCRFCNVKHGITKALDYKEPERVLKAVNDLNLRHVVITSVTRDDLIDGGAAEFVKVIKLLKENGTSVEVLTPDFKGDLEVLKTVLAAGPDVFNHNIETTRALSKTIRPSADYEQSLKVLKYAKDYFKGTRLLVKSGFMLGLGESEEDIYKTINDLAFVDILTIGQYFKPNNKCISVSKEYTEEDFIKFKKYAKTLSFKFVFSGTYVRSSYMAEEVFKELGS